MSLARKHKQRVQHEKAQHPATQMTAVFNDTPSFIKNVKGALPSALQKLKDGFDGERHTLKLLQGDEQKRPFKRELIERYRPLCEYFMQHYEDWARLDCLFWWLLWRSDMEAFADVEPDLYQALQHGLTTPMKGFERDWQTFYSDIVYLDYHEKIKAGQDCELTVISQLVADMTNGDIIINIPLKAKLYAVYGKVTMRLGQTETAVRAFNMALNLNENVGVKKLLTECEALLESASLDESEPGEHHE